MKIKVYETKVIRIPFYYFCDEDGSNSGALRQLRISDTVRHLHHYFGPEWHIGPIKDNMIENAVDMQWIREGYAEHIQ